MIITFPKTLLMYEISPPCRSLHSVNFQFLNKPYLYWVNDILASPGSSRPKDYLPELSVGGNHVLPPHVNLRDLAGVRKPSHTVRG